MSPRLLHALALLPVVAACSPAPAPVSQDLRDPSNPSAPEGTSVMASAASAPASTPAPVSSSDAGVVYVCPMHPEVTSSTPSTCPKCNMKLVPKK